MNKSLRCCPLLPECRKDGGHVPGGWQQAQDLAAGQTGCPLVDQIHGLCACAAETIVKVYLNSRRRTWLSIRLAARLLIRSTAYAHAQRQEL